MENSYKFNVAGHVFKAVFPEEVSAEGFLQPYMPFLTDEASDPLFVLTIEYADDLKELQPGAFRDCMNDEAPFFLIF